MRSAAPRLWHRRIAAEVSNNVMDLCVCVCVWTCEIIILLVEV